MLASPDEDLRSRLIAAWTAHFAHLNHHVLHCSEYPDQLKDRARNLDAYMTGRQPEMKGESAAAAAVRHMTVPEAAEVVSEIISITAEVIGLDAIDSLHDGEAG